MLTSHDSTFDSLASASQRLRLLSVLLCGTQTLLSDMLAGDAYFVVYAHTTLAAMLKKTHISNSSFPERSKISVFFPLSYIVLTSLGNLLLSLASRCSSVILLFSQIN